MSLNEKLVILIGAIPLGAILINYFLSRSILGYSYRLFVAPGVIVHELAHAFGCLVTGSRITAFSILDKRGGHVEHYRPKIPILGQIIISFAPLLAGGAAIYFLSPFIGFRELDFSLLPLSVAKLKTIFWYFILSVNWYDIKELAIFYLLLSIAVTMNPSWQDLKNIIILLLFFILAGYLIYHWTIFRPDFAAYTPPALTFALSLIDSFLLLALFFSIIIYVLSKLVRPHTL